MIGKQGVSKGLALAAHDIVKLPCVFFLLCAAAEKSARGGVALRKQLVSEGERLGGVVHHVLGAVGQRKSLGHYLFGKRLVRHRGTVAAPVFAVASFVAVHLLLPSDSDRMTSSTSSVPSAVESPLMAEIKLSLLS